MIDAADIPAITRIEARQLARTELDHFLALLDMLTNDDWTQPTDCTLWNVRQMAAHQAGAYASYARLREFLRQVVFNTYMRQSALPVDGINRRQVEDRAQTPPADLIAELRAIGYKAIERRLNLPEFLRSLSTPPIPQFGKLNVGYFMDAILTRDTWMHRADICRATGRAMLLTAEHDGRIVALVMRDLAPRLKPLLADKSIVYELAGAAGGLYRFGGEAPPVATLSLDMLEFNRLASGRLKPQEAQSLITITGDASLAQRVLENTFAPY